MPYTNRLAAMVLAAALGLPPQCFAQMEAAAPEQAARTSGKIGGTGDAATPGAASVSAPGAPPRRAGPVRPRAEENPFAAQLIPWFSLEPQGTALIRAAPEGGYDLTARDDQTYITVFGKKKVVDPRTDREHDYTAPSWSDIGLPKDIPIGPPGSCSSGAYRTIGGQPATGADLVGGLGGGRC